jgi:hypothetical protein
MNVHGFRAVRNLVASFATLVDPFVIACDERPFVALAPESLEALPYLAFASLPGARLIDRRNTAMVLARDDFNGVPESQEPIERVRGVQALAIPPQASEKRRASSLQQMRFAKGTDEFMSR